MQYKDVQVGRSYHRGVKTLDPDGTVKIIRLCEEIRAVARLLDELAIAWNRANQKKPKEIWITAALQPRKMPSLHPYGRALDFRIQDWDAKFRAILTSFLLLLKQTDPDYHYQFEDDAPGGPHLHVQFGTKEMADREKLPFVTSENVYV